MEAQPYAHQRQRKFNQHRQGDQLKTLARQRGHDIKPWPAVTTSGRSSTLPGCPAGSGLPASVPLLLTKRCTHQDARVSATGQRWCGWPPAPALPAALRPHLEWLGLAVLEPRTDSVTGEGE